MGFGAVYGHFLPSGFICSQSLSTPSHTQVKQPLGRYLMNEFQSQIVSILKKNKLSMCADDIARRMKPRSNRIAVTSSLRSMEKRDFVGRIPPRDQWSNAHWFTVDENLPNTACTGQEPAVAVKDSQVIGSCQ